MSNPVLTEDTLKDLEELLAKGTPGHFSGYGSTIWAGDKLICENLIDRDEKLLCALRNNGAELVRGYRIGIVLDKDRKP